MSLPLLLLFAFAAAHPSGAAFASTATVTDIDLAGRRGVGFAASTGVVVSAAVRVGIVVRPVPT